MKQMKTDRVLLGISAGGFLMMAASFLLMPIEALRIVPGLCFWLGLLTGVVLQFVLEARRRAFFRVRQVDRKKMQKPRNGLLTFGSNRAATVADNGMIVGFVATVLAFVLTRGYGVLCYVLIAATVFAFCMHCILNGRIYFHARNQTKIQQVLEQKKANSKDKGEGEDEKD